VALTFKQCSGDGTGWPGTYHDDRATFHFSYWHKVSFSSV
jgi:hypothetical protein